MSEGNKNDRILFGIISGISLGAAMFVGGVLSIICAIVGMVFFLKALDAI